jgi:hypothetical protein
VGPLRGGRAGVPGPKSPSRARRTQSATAHQALARPRVPSLGTRGRSGPMSSISLPLRGEG